jgi:hypothetical protein
MQTLVKRRDVSGTKDADWFLTAGYGGFASDTALRLPVTYLDQHSLPRMDRDLSQPACPHTPVFDFEEILLADNERTDKWAYPRLALLERGSTTQTYNGFHKRPFP